MLVWLDANPPPQAATWVQERFGIPCESITRKGFADLEDPAIFELARAADATVMTKDFDFVELVQRLGPPPTVVWLACGNCSNQGLQTLFERSLQDAIERIERGDSLVVIR